MITGAPLGFSINGFLDFQISDNGIFQVFPEIFWFIEAFLKFDGFPGTHGTRSNEAPAVH